MFKVNPHMPNNGAFIIKIAPLIMFLYLEKLALKHSICCSYQDYKAFQRLALT